MFGFLTVLVISQLPHSSPLPWSQIISTAALCGGPLLIAAVGYSILVINFYAMKKWTFRLVEMMFRPTKRDPIGLADYTLTDLLHSEEMLKAFGRPLPRPSGNDVQRQE